MLTCIHLYFVASWRIKFSPQWRQSQEISQRKLALIADVGTARMAAN